MLDNYKDTQNLAYSIMINEIKNNHISHAYLIDENNNINAIEMVMAFVKEIICMNVDDLTKKNICKRIDDGNFPEIKIIEPDGMLIKKQQILDLQKDFSMAPVEGSKRVYIVRDADRMRSETANSMLKFLEEPDNDIVAILMTNNFNNLLSTIISRCQIIRFANLTQNVYEDDILVFAINFIKSLENSGIITICHEQELLFNKFGIKERDKICVFFDKIIDIYYDIMKINIGCLNVKYNLYFDDLNSISNNNSVDKILNKINIFVKYKDAVKNNVNVNLLFDSLIVDVGGLK